MSDSKLNKKIQDAVTGLPGRAASGIRDGLKGTVRKLRLWQEIGLVLCLVSWILYGVTGVIISRTVGAMTDQNFADRWSQESCALVSAFFSDISLMEEETVRSYTSGLAQSLQGDSIALSETQIENGASLVDTAYCGIGSASVSTVNDSLTVTAIGVGGDFFNIHPLDLMSGYYFSADDLMQDRILLDDRTAWRLFGSAYIVGQSVEIDGVPHYIAGVFRRPEGKFYEAAGMGDYLIFISYDSLCRYTETGAAPSEDTNQQDDFDSSGAEARANTSGQAGLQRGSTENEWLPAPGSVLTEETGYAAWVWPALRGSARTLLRTLSDADEELTEADDSDSDAEEADSGNDTTESSEDLDADDEDSSDSDVLQPDYGSGRYTDDEDTTEKVEINRRRISCLETVLPNPISGYGLRLVRSMLSQTGMDAGQMTVVENTSRYDTLRLISLIAEPGVRSMQTAPIRYPYWENVALAWEDVLIPVALLRMVFMIAPILFLFFLLLWYVTHKSWTVGGVVENIKDRIYRHESEKIYGKPAAPALEAGGAEVIPADGQEDAASAGTEENTSFPEGGPAGEEMPAGDRSGGESSSEKMTVEKPAGEKASAEEMSVEKSAGEKVSAEDMPGEEPAGEKASAEDMPGEESAG